MLIIHKITVLSIPNLLYDFGLKSLYLRPKVRSFTACIDKIKPRLKRRGQGNILCDVISSFVETLVVYYALQETHYQVDLLNQSPTLPVCV